MKANTAIISVISVITHVQGIGNSEDNFSMFVPTKLMMYRFKLK